MKKQGINVLSKLLLVAIVLGLLLPVAAQAAKGDAARIEKLEAAVKALETKLEAKDNKANASAAPEWINRITPSGDFRYRYESVHDQSGDELANERRRNRIRARLGFKAEIDAEWDAIFRVATGSTDTATSTNQTLDSSFEEKDLWLDLGYVDWHPQGCSASNVYLGKMKNLFYKVGKNQLIWDGDVNPEGGAATYGIDLGSSTEATFVAGGFWLDERDSGADAGYFGIQSMLKTKCGDDRHLISGVSYYDIGNIDGEGPSGVSLNGNTDAGGGTYMYDFDIVEGFLEYGWKCKCCEMPIAVFGNLLENLAAPNGHNQAYSIGIQINKAKKPGSWQFQTSYREVESDAVFAGLSDSDFIDGGTGGKGWVLGGKYQLTKNIQTALTCFLNDRDRRSSSTGRQNFERLQADLIFKF